LQLPFYIISIQDFLPLTSSLITTYQTTSQLAFYIPFFQTSSDSLHCVDHISLSVAPAPNAFNLTALRPTHHEIRGNGHRGAALAPR
jgi:hypothetical protein